MSKVTIKLNYNGVRALLKSPELQNVVMDEAQKIQSRAGEGYELDERNYPERTGAAVRTATYEAMVDNSENNTLRKAMGK